MTEKTLRDYFENIIQVNLLIVDLRGSQKQEGNDTIYIHIEQIRTGGEYQVTRQHLLKLCNDCINGILKPIDLNTVAYALIFSDYFTWDRDSKDGEIIAQTISDWDNPEISFPLTIGNIRLWQEYLQTGEYKLS